jgi:hypothetical protein
MALLAAYRVMISPFFGSCCRFTPSCSRYAYMSVRGHGVIRGGWWALRRLGRCHPWHPGGEDPVPDPRTWGKG